MKTLENMKKLLGLIFFTFVLYSFSNPFLNNCKDLKGNILDSLSGDFNHNSKIDKILILKRNENLIFQIYEDGNNTPKVNSNKTLYRIGDINCSEKTDFVFLSFENNIITIMQEFGSASPDGFCSAYITNAHNEYVIDSISIDRKRWGTEKVTLERKSKKINKKIEKTNLVKEFNTLFEN